MANRKPDRVYFARVGDYIKVGCSGNPRKRVGQLRCRTTHLLFPDDLPDDWWPTLLGDIPGDKAREADIHADLWEWRAVGEWFEASDVVLAYIDTALGSVAA